MPPTLEEVELLQTAGVPGGGPRLVWLQMKKMAGWRRRLRFFLLYIVPSPAYMQRQYRVRYRWLVPFYYPYRWVATLGKLLTFRP